MDERREIWMKGERYGWKKVDMVGMREIWIEGGRYGLKERDMD